MTRTMFADRIPAEKMDDFIRDFATYRLDEVLGPWKPYRDVIVNAVQRTARKWGIKDLNRKYSMLDMAKGALAVALGSQVLLRLPTTAHGVLRPTAASAAVVFALSIDDFIITYFVSGPSTTTFPVRIFGQSRTATPPQINVLSTMILLVSVMLANNEIGAINDLAAIGKIHPIYERFTLADSLQAYQKLHHNDVRGRAVVVPLSDQTAGHGTTAAIAPFLVLHARCAKRSTPPLVLPPFFAVLMLSILGPRGSLTDMSGSTGSLISSPARLPAWIISPCVGLK